VSNAGTIAGNKKITALSCNKKYFVSVKKMISTKFFLLIFEQYYYEFVITFTPL